MSLVVTNGPKSRPDSIRTNPYSKLLRLRHRAAPRAGLRGVQRSERSEEPLGAMLEKAPRSEQGLGQQEGRCAGGRPNRNNWPLKRKRSRNTTPKLTGTNGPSPPA